MKKNEMFDYDFIDTINAAYWAEEDEMRAGTHPSQVKEKIVECLSENGVSYTEITFLDWSVGGTNVRVSLDNVVYGVFNYSKNCFE